VVGEDLGIEDHTGCVDAGAVDGLEEITISKSQIFVLMAMCRIFVRR
jgi:hypothetical protein